MGLTSFLGRRFVVATVRGLSMEPTFRSGERVLVRRGQKHRVGQIVVVRMPGDQPTEAGPFGGRRWMIKRVVATAGDPVPANLRARLAGTVVPAGKLVVLGDNAAVSNDSRTLGYFAAEEVLGTVLRRI
ncbi:S26 family signal peptidase [Fodinicola acaciae]|uniref:S26 family signal peptidase n=1 Tax=Fodinicola acaciae TaxID=2681555 RepID=UPI0013D50B45|nr:S26 family signal peptidase [Fodinicola acaciae]